MQVRRVPTSLMALVVVSLVATSVRAESPSGVVTAPPVDQPAPIVAAPPSGNTGFEPARAPAVVQPLALPKQTTTPENPGDLLLSQRKRSVERDHYGYFISGGIITAVGVGLLAGGLAMALNQELNRESHAVIGSLGIGVTVIGSSHLVLGAVFLGIGGYRHVHANDPIEPE